MNRFALVAGILFVVLGIVNLDVSPSHIPILAYPLAAIGLVLVVLSFIIPPHYLQSADREEIDSVQSVLAVHFSLALSWITVRALGRISRSFLGMILKAHDNPQGRARVEQL